jgi:hypothetical protein
MGDELGSQDSQNKSLDRREVTHKLLIELLASVPKAACFYHSLSHTNF